MCRPASVCELLGSLLVVKEVQPVLHCICLLLPPAGQIGNCALLVSRVRHNLVAKHLDSHREKKSPKYVVCKIVPTAFESEHLLVWSQRWNCREVWQI